MAKDGFTKWTGEHEQQLYEAKLEDDSVVPCWPYNGQMYALDGSGKAFKPDEVSVRKVDEDFPEGEDKCTFWHHWSKWKDHKTVGISRGDAHISDILVQMKVCKKCGERRYRQETVWDANKER